MDNSEERLEQIYQGQSISEDDLDIEGLGIYLTRDGRIHISAEDIDLLADLVVERLRQVISESFFSE